MTALDVFFPAGKANEYRDARRLAICFEAVVDILRATDLEEWEHFRICYFGAPGDRHDRNHLRISLCFYDAWTSTFNTLSVLSFGQMDEMARNLTTRAAILRDRARLRIRWRRSPRPLPKVV